MAACLGACLFANAQNGTITTIAGNGSREFSGDGEPAISAGLSAISVAVDARGNIFIADSINNRIRKVSVSGVITTVAGNGMQGFSGDGGPATSASLSYPAGIALDAAGNLFISDSSNYRIRKVSIDGAISTIAGNGVNGFSGDGGPAISASLSDAGGIAVDSSGNVFFADDSNNRIRRVSPGGIITTVAGNGNDIFSGDGGLAITASISGPDGVAVDRLGNLFISDFFNCRIRKVSQSGIITTLAGNGSCGLSGDGGPATSASLSKPAQITVDASGNVFFADSQFNNRIREVSVVGVITTVAGDGSVYVGNWGGFSGDGGPATSAQLSEPVGVAVSLSGNLIIGDSGNNRVREVTGVSTSPSVTSEGIVPLYNTVNTVQPGEWISIFGSNLAASTTVWSGNFPTSLGGTSVAIDGKSAYLWFVSPTQINLQVPDNSTIGTVPVVVTTANGVVSSSVTIAQFAPSFSLLDSKHVTGIILRSDGSGAYGSGAYDIIGPTGTSLGYPTVAAKAGDLVTLFAVGLGPTNPPVSAGQSFSGSAPTVGEVGLFVNNVGVTPFYSGLSSAGLYQINLTIPTGLGSGDVPLSAMVGGAQTQSGVVISLQ